jgi:hypothetical protein
VAYEDEVSDIIKGATSQVEHPDEDEDTGTDTLAQVGSPTPFGTGRFSPNGNELPPRLYNRDRPPSDVDDSLRNVPDAQYAAATGAPAATVPGVATADTSTVAPGRAAVPDYANEGFAGELANLRQGDRTTRMMENQPSEADTISPLQDTLAAANVPVDQRQRAYDPNQPIGPGNQPGQENYRPSVGSRILRGVQGYARRGIVGAVDPAAAGVKPYGAGNADYDAEVARRVAAAKTATERITQAQATYKERQAQLKQQAESEQAQSLGYSRLPTGVAGQANAASATMRANADKQRADQESPARKAAAQDAEYQRIDAQNNDPKSLFSKLPMWAKLYRLGNGGKVPEGIKGRESTAEESMYQKVATAWQRDPANQGKTPTAADVADMVAESKGQEKPSAKLTEQQSRDTIRTATTRLSTAARALAAAQKATQGYVPKEKRQAVNDAVDNAQKDFDAATNLLNGLGTQNETESPVAGGGAAGGPARPEINAIDQSNPPPMSALQGLRPGQGRKFKNGQTWTVVNGRQKRVS